MTVHVTPTIHFHFLSVASFGSKKGRRADSGGRVNEKEQEHLFQYS
jgi:hypothetical protein